MKLSDQVKAMLEPRNESDDEIKARFGELYLDEANIETRPFKVLHVHYVDNIGAVLIVEYTDMEQQ
jgi:hypothetical protein